MLKTNTIERTEKKAALGLNGNGHAQNGLQSAQVLYRQIAALASALGRIERELRDSQGWLHDGDLRLRAMLHSSCADSGGLSRRAIGSWRSWTP
jgi:hypothetical protein